MSDMDSLRADQPTVSLLGLENIRGSRRMGEYLTLFGSDSLKAVYNVTRSLCLQVALNAIEHFVKAKGYPPLFLFIDGTEIEVEGRLFEEAKMPIRIQ